MKFNFWHKINSSSFVQHSFKSKFGSVFFTLKPNHLELKKSLHQFDNYI